jgi:CRISPR-associated protein (TIGR02584 family)
MSACLNRKYLIAVTGGSPAVLTETIWALAHQPDPWIPDQIVLITTRIGDAAARDRLLEQQGWKRLCEALQEDGRKPPAFGASDSIRVIGNGYEDFDDIRTPEESAAAADFILGVLRQYTEQPDTEIIASIAGGRKTMSALLMACMSLLGREQDRVCHVLANEEFIRDHPDFIFPRNADEAARATIRITDIPFIRVRGWYEQESSGRVPPSYRHMVSLFRERAPEAVVLPPVELNSKQKLVSVGKSEYRLNDAEFTAVWTFWWSRHHEDFSDGRDLAESVERFGINSLKEPEDFSKRLNAVKTKIEKDHPEIIKRLFPGIKSKTFNYPALRFRGHLRISNRS